MKRLLLPLLAAATLLACSTIDTPQPGRGGAVFTIRGKSYDEIWRAVVSTTSRQLTIVDNHKHDGVLRAESRVGWTTWGEVVGVFVRPARPGAPAYTIEVQSLPRATLQITGQDWTASLVGGIKAELKQ